MHLLKKMLKEEDDELDINNKEEIANEDFRAKPDEKMDEISNNESALNHYLSFSDVENIAEDFIPITNSTPNTVLASLADKLKTNKTTTIKDFFKDAQMVIKLIKKSLDISLVLNEQIEACVYEPVQVAINTSKDNFIKLGENQKKVLKQYFGSDCVEDIESSVSSHLMMEQVELGTSVHQFKKNFYVYRK